jgi:hypothetical protein
MSLHQRLVEAYKLRTQSRGPGNVLISKELNTIIKTLTKTLRYKTGPSQDLVCQGLLRRALRNSHLKYSVVTHSLIAETRDP